MYSSKVGTIEESHFSEMYFHVAAASMFVRLEDETELRSRENAAKKKFQFSLFASRPTLSSSDTMESKLNFIGMAYRVDFLLQMKRKN